MVNPVKQNAGQIPLSTQNFFESDGKTVSLPWRAFLRNISSSVGGETGTDGLPALIIRMNDLANQVGFQATEIEQLYALDAATAQAIAIGALIARIGVIERGASAVVPAPVRPPATAIDLVLPHRPASSFPDSFVSWPPGAPALSQLGRLLAIRALPAGVYTPTIGTNSVYVRVQAPGGPGGSTPATGAGQSAAAAGGPAGSYAEGYFTSGFSGMTVSLGTPGVATAGAAGTNSTAASFGALINCPGGSTALLATVLSAPGFVPGSNISALPTVTPSAAQIDMEAGIGGDPGIVIVAGTLSIGGRGGNSRLGKGGQPKPGLGSNVPTGYGAGGSGANAGASQVAQAGAAPSPGFVEVWEFS
jgi:hypothetical protein